MKRSYIFIYFFLISFTNISFSFAQQPQQEQEKSPRIVNIVNFIRAIEPREKEVTPDVLYQTVVEQIKLMTKNDLGGTFLLQYDALIDERYQKLLKALPEDKFELGAWWELPKPLIEKAGIKWRGKYAWDWHSDIGFSVGYTPAEREKIIDVYFNDFKQIFGHYPRSVAAWVIDAHSLNYMYNKYKIVATANCKDQIGTDGFTLWGGYWNQAYYPSKINAYMPAQHASAQIPVPVFRMLGSDPIRQYANGSAVVTLEPVYPEAGGNKNWINWFFETFTKDSALGFNYTQAGQENSFTWSNMKTGLEIQFLMIARLKNEGKVRVETMEQSGKWFSKKYKVTPATTFTVEKDLGNSDKKTVWYNSRFYRMNILWEHGTMRIADIHLFNEKIPDRYLKSVTTENKSFFYTLPVIDGSQLGKNGTPAGLRLMVVEDGKAVPVIGGSPTFENIGKSSTRITWPSKYGNFVITLKERNMTIKLNDKPAKNWYMSLHADHPEKLTIKRILSKAVEMGFENHSYQLKAIQGHFAEPDNSAGFKVKPDKGKLSFSLNDK
ncbi:hypothetical protein SAMN05421827_102150 [Pedobacter terrae]|uniref:Uncharacterized protein n=1 Tax=Pedobacter terrae TaxID=405671 RepID=A0A1G7Q3D5_9SPHI|nr:hypothetical protein [Pedobacter terrae]SDF92975.1 hypothetical protein SAMN05421827_102150 [Pedobacter terrae]